MKSLFIISLSFFIGVYSNAQNLVQNFSFEELTNKNHPYPTAQNQIDKITFWEDDACTTTSGPNQGIHHSPDWVTSDGGGAYFRINQIYSGNQSFTTDARTGQMFIGMAHDEYIGQNIQNLEQGKEYKLTLHMRKTNRYPLGISSWSENDNVKLKVYASKNKITYKYSCSNYVNNHLCEYGQTGGNDKNNSSQIIEIASFEIGLEVFRIISNDINNKEWYVLQSNFILPSNDYKWISIEQDKCYGRTLIDDIYIQDVCNCQDNKLIENKRYQHYNYKEETNSQIIAGENVGAQSRNYPVEIGNTSNVVYKAGQSITLQAGFSIEAGANFSAIIEGCDYPFGTIDPLQMSYNPYFSPPSDPVCIENVTNVNSYVIRVNNRWGNLIGEYYGNVIDNQICFGEDLNWHNPDQLIAYVYFYNCTESIAGQINLMLLGPSGKPSFENEVLSFKDETSKNQIDCDLFGIKNEIRIIDINGKVLLSLEDMPNQNIKELVSKSNISAGIYFIQNLCNPEKNFKTIKL